MSGRLAVVGIAMSGFFVLAACASTQPQRSVEVAVNGESDVNAERLRAFTLEAISRVAPGARDMRIAVDLGGPSPTTGRTLPTSTTLDYAIPAVAPNDPARPSVSAGAGSAEVVEGLTARGSYSISDAAGHVLATGPIEAGASVHDRASPDRSPLELRIALLRGAADYLASRVAALRSR